MSERRIGVYLLLIGSLGMGFVTGRAFFFNVAYLFGALLIGSWLWARTSTFGVQIARRTPTRQTAVGRTFDEQLSVINTSWLPKLWLEVRDGSTLPDHHVSRVSTLLWPRGKQEWSAQTVCSTRGQFTLGPMTLVGGDPFGLFQSKRQLTATASVLVFPASVPVESFVAMSGDQSGGDSDRRKAQFVTTNAAGIRDYQPGDSMNRIHWRSSARRDQLLVKEFEIDPLGDVWLWLDLSAQSLIDALSLTAPMPYPPAYLSESQPYIPPSSEEYAIVIASSLARYFLSADRALGFITHCPNRVMLHPDRGVRQLMKIQETLAMAHSGAYGDAPGSGLSLAQAMIADGHAPGRGSTVVIVSADLSPSWGAEAYRIKQRGAKVSVVLIDPASFGGTEHAELQAIRLENGGMATRVVRYGDNLSASLAG
jgi:uncharacterized protein (DUF58 family)